MSVCEVVPHSERHGEPNVYQYYYMTSRNVKSTMMCSENIVVLKCEYASTSIRRENITCELSDAMICRPPFSIYFQ